MRVKKTKIDGKLHRFEYNETTKLWTHRIVSSIDYFVKEPIKYDDLTDLELRDILSNCNRVESFET
jgi:hypothetical protein